MEAKVTGSGVLLIIAKTQTEADDLCAWWEENKPVGKIGNLIFDLGTYEDKYHLQNNPEAK